MTKIRLAGIFTFFIIIFQLSAIASVPALSGTVENGKLTVTVSGISGSCPQIIVLSKNNSDNSDFYLDTIDLESGQKTITHNGAKGESYSLTGLMKNKDGTDGGYIYGTASSVGPTDSAKNPVSQKAYTSKVSSNGNSAYLSSSKNGKFSSSSLKLPANETSHVSSSCATSSGSSADGNASSGYNSTGYISKVTDDSGQSGNSFMPLIIMSIILIGTSVIFARKFSKKDK